MDAGLRRVAWNDEERRFRAPVRLGLATVLLLSAGEVIRVVAVGLATAGSGLGPVPRAAAVIALAAAGLAAAIVAVLGVARWLDRRRAADLGVALDRAWLADAGRGAAVGAAMVAGVLAVALLSGLGTVDGLARSWVGSLALTSVHPAFDAAFWLVVFLGTGALEEVLFRGYLLVNVAEGLSGYAPDRSRAVLGGVAVSAVAFGLAHATNPGGSALGVANVVLFGLLLGGTVAATGRLAVAVGLHVAWNATLGLGAGLPVSGIETGAALVDVELAGPVVLTGGGFGPEGGLLALVGLGVGVGALGWLLWRRGALSVDGGLATPDLLGDGGG